MGKYMGKSSKSKTQKSDSMQPYLTWCIQSNVFYHFNNSKPFCLMHHVHKVIVKAQSDVNRVFFIIGLL